MWRLTVTERADMRSTVLFRCCARDAAPVILPVRRIVSGPVVGSYVGSTAFEEDRAP